MGRYFQFCNVDMILKIIDIVNESHNLSGKIKQPNLLDFQSQLAASGHTCYYVTSYWLPCDFNEI